MSISHWIRHEAAGRAIKLLHPLLDGAAWIWRRLLFRTRFIAVTGSLGKTTTKDCLYILLSSRYRTFRSVRNQNGGALLALNILRVRPWHQYAVMEVASRGPGDIARRGGLVQPDVAIVTCVCSPHQRSYSSLEETAVEKLQLLEQLRPGGLGLINSDDPRLLAGVKDGKHRLMKFGSVPESDLVCSEVRSIWPGRLEFMAGLGAKRVPVKTSLLGKHWVHPVAGAILAAAECGIPVEASAGFVGELRPFDARMQPVRLPSGAVVVRDDYNGSEESFDVALSWFEEARAQRRILIAGDYSDSRKKTKSRLAQLGRRAAGFCDHAVFVGPHAHHSERGALNEGMPADRVTSFSSIRAAVPHVQELLQKDDLVLFKSRSGDHFARLLFALVGPVSCWKTKCSESFLCDICWRLGTPRRDREQLVPLERRGSGLIDELPVPEFSRRTAPESREDGG